MILLKKKKKKNLVQVIRHTRILLLQVLPFYMIRIIIITLGLMIQIV